MKDNYSFQESWLEYITTDWGEYLDKNQVIYTVLTQGYGSLRVESSLKHQPKGIESAAISAGIKSKNVLDFAVVKLPECGPASGVFTLNRCASPAVVIDREHLADGQAQVLVVISKNANVFTPTAQIDAKTIIGNIAERLSVKPENVILSCTGVIGVSLPMDRISCAITKLSGCFVNGISDDVSEAILTTDKAPKVASINVGDMVISGMAKGAGMLEPKMATMLVYFFTNLDIPSEILSKILYRVVDKTFNSLTVDSDTSTSDSVVVFSTAELPLTQERLCDFERALGALALKLSHEIVCSAEGATKIIEVLVHGASDDPQAKVIAKLIANSPLVKTAINGGDPNWGRVVMAIGKPDQENTSPIRPECVKITIEGIVLFDQGRSLPVDLKVLSSLIRMRSKITIEVSLGDGLGQATVWGCDLSSEYVRINAEYTT